MRLTCTTCGKPVSSEAPDKIVVRAVIDCPECLEKRPDDVFPFIAKPTSSGMVISLDGVISRVSEELKRHRDVKHLSFDIELLQTHIEQLRESTSNDDAVRRLNNFLQLWVKS